MKSADLASLWLKIILININIYNIFFCICQAACIMTMFPHSYFKGSVAPYNFSICDFADITKVALFLHKTLYSCITKYCKHLVSQYEIIYKAFFNLYLFSNLPTQGNKLYDTNRLVWSNCNKLPKRNQ